MGIISQNHINETNYYRFNYTKYLGSNFTFAFLYVKMPFSTLEQFGLVG